jgi:PAS domain S-box-containing protein
MGILKIVIHALLVDDEKALLEIASRFLHSLDQDLIITCVDSAEKALIEISEEDFDIVVSDYMMPIMNGLELLADLRNSGNDIPFIVFTGKSREEVAIEALNLGATFYIRKGGDPKSQYAELIHNIKTAVGHARARRELKECAEQYRLILDSITDPLNVVDEDMKVVLVNPSHIERARKLGVEKDPVGKDLFEAFPFLSDRVRDEIKQVFSTRGTVVTYESVTYEGKELFTETRKIPIFKKGEVIQVLTVVHEFTEYPIKENRF